MEKHIAMKYINWELEKLAEKKLEENPSANPDYIREKVGRDFGEWIVRKFEEESE